MDLIPLIESQEYPYYFIHWINLERDHLILYDHKQFGRFRLELLRTLSDTDSLTEKELGIPTALRRESSFKVSKFRIGKSSKTVGLIFGIEDVLINPLGKPEDSNFVYPDMEAVLNSKETIFESKHLNELKYCKGLVIYISEIEVEYIHFSLKRPFSFDEVLRLYTRSSLDIVKKSTLYQAMQMFKKYELCLPVVFCVKGTSEPEGSMTRVGTNEDSDYESEDSCECSCEN